MCASELYRKNLQHSVLVDIFTKHSKINSLENSIWRSLVCVISTLFTEIILLPAKKCWTFSSNKLFPNISQLKSGLQVVLEFGSYMSPEANLIWESALLRKRHGHCKCNEYSPFSIVFPFLSLPKIRSPNNIQHRSLALPILSKGWFINILIWLMFPPEHSYEV